jgi:hypothetical protein
MENFPARSDSSCMLQGIWFPSSALKSDWQFEIYKVFIISYLIFFLERYLMILLIEARWSGGESLMLAMAQEGGDGGGPGVDGQ